MHPGWRPASCWPDDCFCEAIWTGAVAQPANTWSGLAFVGVAALILYRSRALPARERSRAWTLSAVVTLLALGTMVYHASLTFAGQMADVIGMYLFVSFLLLDAVAWLRPLSSRSFVSAYAVGNLLLAALIYGWPGARRPVFAALVVATVLCEARATRRRPAGRLQLLGGAVAVLGLGFLFWGLDLTRVLCSPTSLWQGHAFWHLCAAAAAYLAFEYGRGPGVQAATGARL